MNWKQMIKSFQQHLKIERGLSENTIKAYTADLKKLEHWIDDHNIKEGPHKISSDIINDFIYYQAKNIHVRSQARLRSSFRVFLVFFLE